MEGHTVFIAISVVAMAFFAIVGFIQFADQQSSANQEQEVREKFAGLQDMNGMSLQEISEAVGIEPSSATSQADGTMLYQWMFGGTHIAIVFRDDIFVGVAHESYV